MMCDTCSLKGHCCKEFLIFHSTLLIQLTTIKLFFFFFSSWRLHFLILTMFSTGTATTTSITTTTTSISTNGTSCLVEIFFFLTTQYVRPGTNPLSWCLETSPKCNVNTFQACCYLPKCKEMRPSECSWIDFLKNGEEYL